MKSETENQASVFHYPILLSLTAILCLVSYQVFGLNTAAGVATGAVALAFCTFKRKSKTPVSESN